MADFSDTAPDTRSNAIVKTSERRYAQCLYCEWEPAVYVNGEPVSWRRVVVTLNVTETVTEYRGLSQAGANAVLAANPPDVTMHSSGKYETHSLSVDARRVNEADGWRVTVTEKTASATISS